MYVKDKDNYYTRRNRLLKAANKCPDDKRFKAIMDCVARLRKYHYFGVIDYW